MLQISHTTASIQIPELSRSQVWRIHYHRIQNMHARWAQFALHSIDWENWPLELWSTLRNAVETSLCGRIYENLKTKAGAKVLGRIEADFVPITFQKPDRQDVIATTVLQMAVLLDEGYQARDRYMKAFTEILKSYVYSILVHSLSVTSMKLAEREMRTNFLGGMIAVKVKKNGIFRTTVDCPLTIITRMRGVSLCLSIVKPISKTIPHPSRSLSWDRMEYIRMANQVLHMLLFEANMTGQQALGALYFVAVAENKHPDQSSAMLRMAQRLL